MVNFKYVSFLSTLSLVVIFVGVLTQAYLELRKLNKLTLILTNLVHLEHSYEKILDNGLRTKPKIAVGYGSCSDLYVTSNFLNYSTEEVGDFQTRNMNDDEIHNEEDFVQSFAYYFTRGAAAERFTSNETLFRKLVQKAKKHQSARWAMGGNAPVMSSRFHKEGAEVLLASTMSKKLKSHLMSGIHTTQEEDVEYEDDIHLIIEYKTGDEWGALKTPRANRYILHHDRNNPMIKSLELLNNTIKNFDPRLFVVSGLQMMDNYPYTDPAVRLERLMGVKSQMIQHKNLIHFEMASFVEIELLNLLLKNIIPYADSLGMNEQELDNIEEVLEKGKISLSADSNPRVATALDQMRNVFRILNNNYYHNSLTNRNHRMLTRIHVHTLAYQAFMVVRNTEWKNTKHSAAKSSLTAHRHVCANEVVNPENSYLVLDDSFSTSVTDSSDNTRPKRIHLEASAPVPCWNETIQVNAVHKVHVEICIAPVLVCREAKQTAGAGDNISAAGLVLQI